MKKGNLIIFSGLPASGKTTLASKISKTLNAAYLRIDAIELGFQDKIEIPEFGEKCYRVAQLLAKENLRLGNSVVSDSVNPWGVTRKEWNQVAIDLGVNFFNIEVICSNKEEHRNRLQTRTTTLQGLVDPNWEQIQQREYHAWDQDRILIDTSGKSVEESFQELLSKLPTR